MKKRTREPYQRKRTAAERLTAGILSFALILFPFPSVSIAEVAPVSPSPTGQPIPTIPFDEAAPPPEPDQTLQQAADETDAGFLADENPLSEPTPETTLEGSVTINDGSEYTSRAAVDLKIEAADENSDVTEYRFSTDDGEIWSDWKSFASSDPKEDERMKTEAGSLLEGDPYSTEGLTEEITSQSLDAEGRITREARSYSDAEGNVLISTSLNRSYNSAGVNTYEDKNFTLFDDSGNRVQTVSQTVMRNSEETPWLESVSVSDNDPQTGKTVRTFGYSRTYDSRSLYEYQYDADGRQTEYTSIRLDPDWNVKSKNKTVSVYHKDGKLKTRTEDSFDSAGILISHKIENYTYHDTTGQRKTYEEIYQDGSGHVTQQTFTLYRENGQIEHQERITYDPFGEVSSRTLTTYDYNEEGKMSKWTRRQFDGNGTLQSEETFEYFYNEAGKKTKEIQTTLMANGTKTIRTYLYNDQGKNTVDERITYDTNGFMQYGTTTSYVDDEKGRQISQITENKDASGTVTSKSETLTEYDSETGRRQRQTELQFTAGGLLTSRKITDYNASGQAEKSVSVTWDSNGNEKGTETYIYSYEGGTTSYTRTYEERFPAEYTPSTTTETTKYPSGKIESTITVMRDERGFETRTVIEYDENGKQTKEVVTRFDPIGEAYYRVTFFTAYENGLTVKTETATEYPKRGTSSRSEILYEYYLNSSQLKRRMSTSEQENGTHSTSTITYNEAGFLLRTEILSYGSGGQLVSKTVQTRSYNAEGKLTLDETWVENGLGKTTSYSKTETVYDAGGTQKQTERVTTESLGNYPQIVETYYTETNQIERKNTITLDAYGNVSKKISTSTAYENSRITKQVTITEDGTGRMLSTDEATYTYDSNGNMASLITKSQSADGSHSEAVNRYDQGRVKSSEGTTYFVTGNMRKTFGQYDDSGRQTESADVSYDALGNIQSIYITIHGYNNKGLMTLTENISTDGKGNLNYDYRYESEYDSATGKLSKSTSSYLYGDGRGWTSTTVYEYDASGNQTGSVTTSEQMKGDGTSPKRLDLVERFAGDVSAINPAEKTIRAALTLSGGDGEKNVLVEIRNALGATKTVSDAIILDTTAPVASFKINGGAETTTARDIQIDLSQIQDATSGIAGVKISTDDGATWTEVDWAALGADKVYSTKLSGDTGSKKVLVEVRDKAGLRSVESRTIQLESDATAPEVILPEGIHGSTVNEPTYRLHYTVDGIPQTRIFELAEGENQIQFTETDAAGNETVISFTVTLDTTPPVISLSQELDGSITNKSQMTVVYIVDGIEKTKTFELVEGENLLEIIETDSAGNSSVLAFTVIREPAVNPVLAQAIADELGIDPKDVKSVSVTEIEGRTYLEVTIATEEGEKRFIGVQVSEKEVRLFEVPSSDITVDALNALEKELGHPLESLKSLTFESLVVCLSTSCPAFAYKFEAAAEELGRTVIYRGQVIGPSVDDPDAATLILIQQIEVQFSEADNPTVESRIFDSEGRLIEVHFRDGAVMTISYDDPDYTYVIREGDRVVRAAKSVQFGKKDPDITDPNLRIIYADSNAFQFPGYENLTKEEMPLLAEAMHKIFSEFKDSELPDVLTSVSAKRDPQSILCVINLLCPPSNTLKLVSENKGTFTASFRETRYESPYHNRYELEEITKSDLPQVEAIKAVLESDLAGTFGFSADQLKELIDRGLITIEGDFKDLKATVTIDPSVQLPTEVAGVNLFNLLGSNELPNQIEYKLGEVFQIFLVSGSFNLDGNYYRLSYINPTGIWEAGDNRLYSVDVFADNPNSCPPGMFCLAPAVMPPSLKGIRYQYMDNDFFLATIKYYDGSQGDVASRVVEITKLKAFNSSTQVTQLTSSYHIQAIVDQDQDGNVMARSEFTYGIMQSALMVYPPIFNITLDRITRTDRDGTLLSRIQEIHPSSEKVYPPVYEATIILPNNEKVVVTFKNFEDLLHQALKIESETRIVPFEVSISLFPNGSPNLKVSVAEDGTARVTYFGTTKTGVFNVETKSVEIAFTTSFGTETWILKFTKNESQNGNPYSLDSYQRITSNSAGSYQQETAYYFSQDGVLNRVEYIINTDSSATHGKIFHGYDSDGKHWISATIEKVTYSDGRILNKASYETTDKTNKQRISASVYLRDDSLFNSINSAEQYQEIENAAYVKTISYFGDGALSSFLFSIEFAKNNSGVFIPRRVNKTYGQVLIVQGEPDVLNVESDDFLFKDGQMVGDYRISFGPITNLQGGPFKYGLTFSKKTTQNTGLTALNAESSGAIIVRETYQVVAIVDFPFVNTVELEGVTYEIKIDQEGGLFLRETESPEVVVVKETVQDGLINTFGFSADQLKELIDRGLVKIEVDLKNLKATVTIDPSVTVKLDPKATLPEGLGVPDLVNLLGSNNRLPDRIEYKLGEGLQMEAPCSVSSTGVTVCPPPQPPFLVSGSFELDGRYYQLSFQPDHEGDITIMPVTGDNRLDSVRIFDRGPCVAGEVCLAVMPNLLKEIHYKYTEDDFFLATIKYHDGSQGDVASRVVEITRLKEFIPSTPITQLTSSYYIQAIVDQDQNGNVMARSEFTYVIEIQNILCAEGQICTPPPPVITLGEITRTDRDGKVLSEIKDFQPANLLVMEPRPYQATIVLPDGREKQAILWTMEGLLAEAMTFERSKPSFKSAPVIEKIEIDGTGKIEVPFLAIEGAKIYQVQVARDPDFNDIVYEGFPSGNHEPLELPSEGGDYYVRVRASASEKVEEGPVSEWSEAVFFHVPNMEERPALPTTPPGLDKAHGHDPLHDLREFLKRFRERLNDTAFLFQNALKRTDEGKQTHPTELGEIWWMKDQAKELAQKRGLHDVRFNSKQNVLLESILITDNLEGTSVTEDIGRAGVVATGLIPIRLALRQSYQRTSQSLIMPELPEAVPAQKTESKSQNPLVEVPAEKDKNAR